MLLLYKQYESIQYPSCSDLAESITTVYVERFVKTITVQLPNFACSEIPASKLKLKIMV